MYHPAQILSDNRKTGVSIDLPIAGHCRPTKNCSKNCYARTGPMAFPNATRKHLWISKYLAQPDISQLIAEARPYRAIRLNGSGDLLPEHLPQIRALARSCPGTMFWGMTRKLEIARALMRDPSSHRPARNIRIMVSVDATSPAEIWNYRGTLCYGPRHATDKVPSNDSRIRTIFPYHWGGVMVGDIPTNSKDCPKIRHKVAGCLSCGRCWNWGGTENSRSQKKE